MKLKDLRIERAIVAMKADPKRRWTVQELARLVGMSRAVFAKRFTETKGVPPLRWLTEHRLSIATAELVNGHLALAGVAEKVGYISEFAFAKAFKRLFGVAPGTFRRTSRKLGSIESIQPMMRAA